MRLPFPWSQDRPPRIAICFFGITRSLRFTYPSIEENIIKPARDAGQVSLYGHFFNERAINNPRSGEYGALDSEEYRLLHLDSVQFGEPDSWIDSKWFEQLKSGGDYWGDGFVSLRNLAHQLRSLECVTMAALSDKPDIVAFCRPDLQYHDSMGRYLRKLRSIRQSVAYVPQWQRWGGGLNDRFAICSGLTAAQAYGYRIRKAQKFVTQLGFPCHSERLTYFAMLEAKVALRTLHIRASRIRFDGKIVDEDFSTHKKAFRKGKREFLQALK